MVMFLHYRAKERGATQVMLHVDDTNIGAQRLYESMGYRKMEDRWICDLA
jgi:ribosomal protein S18 acetylase RimI-like enzyme